MDMLVVLSVLVATARGAETFAGSTFYFGDIHAHTGVSPDGGALDLGNCADDTVCLALSDAFATAQGNGLDFVAFPDHSTSDETAFDDFLTDVRAANSASFVTIPAVEMKFQIGTAKIGHKNVYIFEDDDSKLDTLSLANLGPLSSIASCADVWTNAATLSTDFGPTLEFAHHPASDVYPTDWSCHDQTYEPVVEVYSGVGSSLDYASDYDPVLFPNEAGTVHEALETYGLKVGFVAGTDIHDTRPGEVCDTDTEWTGTHVYGGGLTMVVLDEGAAFDRSAIYGEMVARRTLVTSGPRIPIAVQWTTADESVHSIGEELRVRNGGLTRLEVQVPSTWEGDITGVDAVGYADRVALSERSPGVWRVSIQNDVVPSWLYVEVSIDGASYYGGVGACADGGSDDREFVWSSPAWFEHTNDVDGDGYPFARDCNDDDATIHPRARDIPRDGIDQNCDGVDATRIGHMKGGRPGRSRSQVPTPPPRGASSPA